MYFREKTIEETKFTIAIIKLADQMLTYRIIFKIILKIFAIVMFISCLGELLVLVNKKTQLFEISII